MGLSRRKFTKEFKEAPVRRLELGASLAEVAGACEVDPNVLHRWRRELHEHGAKAFPGEGLSRVEEGRLAELERKVGRQAMLAACRRAAETAGVSYSQLVYPYLEKEMSLATPMPLERLCHLSGLSRAGFYRWRESPEETDTDIELRNEIQQIALEWPSYGWRRVRNELGRRRWVVNQQARSAHHARGQPVVFAPATLHRDDRF